MRRYFEDRLFRPFATVVVVALFFLVSLGSESVLSNAKPKITDFDCSPDFGIINGEPDAGVSLRFLIRNVGEDGVIEIKPRVSSSEGEWRRGQTLNFRAGEQRRLTYFFHEPTIKRA